MPMFACVGAGHPGQANDSKSEPSGRLFRVRSEGARGRGAVCLLLFPCECSPLYVPASTAQDAKRGAFFALLCLPPPPPYGCNGHLPAAADACMRRWIRSLQWSGSNPMHLECNRWSWAPTQRRYIAPRTVIALLNLQHSGAVHLQPAKGRRSAVRCGAMQYSP